MDIKKIFTAITVLFFLGLLILGTVKSCSSAFGSIKETDLEEGLRTKAEVRGRVSSGGASTLWAPIMDEDDAYI